MSELPAILFAPVLRGEHWTSIDLQQQNILDALAASPANPRVIRIEVAEGLARLPWGRPWVRDFAYPRAIRSAARNAGRAILHVADHSYGHLCGTHHPSVVNCNDLHHWLHPELPAANLRRWRKRVEGMRQAERVLAISGHLAGELIEHLRLDPARVVAIPGGVDPETFHPAPVEEAAARLPRIAALRGTHFLILNIGTNHQRKNIPTLLRAIQVLRRAKRAVKLLRAGAPLRGSEHEPLIAELGIGDAIIDLGFLAPGDVATLCRLAHVLSFPSLYEGFGRPTLEAQACGLPCVLANASCLPEIGGAGARYHAPNDHEQLAHELSQVLDNESVRTQLITAGLANAARYTWEKHADALLRVYQELGA